MTNADQDYAFGNSVTGQRDRLRALEAVLDGGTFRRLTECGVGPGWRCLEVGAGAGSVATWLADRVGLDGSVLATDLDTTLLDDLVRPPLTVRRHNLMTDPLPEASFDLVHARLLLAWLPDPAGALRRLVTALKPGGWLVVEDLDFASAVPDPDMDPASAALVARVVDAHTAVLAQRSGFDPAFGRRLRGLLEEAALLDVDTEGRASIWRGGEPGGELWRLTFNQLREPMVSAALVETTEVDRAIDLCRHGLSFLSPLAMTAWGRQPANMTDSSSSDRPAAAGRQ